MLQAHDSRGIGRMLRNLSQLTSGKPRSALAMPADMLATIEQSVAASWTKSTRFEATMYAFVCCSHTVRGIFRAHKGGGRASSGRFQSSKKDNCSTDIFNVVGSLEEE